MKTININTENIVISLFQNGFDKADTSFIDILVRRIESSSMPINEDENAGFLYSEKELSSLALEYIDFDGIVYSLKNGLNPRTNDEVKESFSKLTPDVLTEYIGKLEEMDLLPLIVAEKVDTIGLNDVTYNAYSNRELAVLRKFAESYSAELLKPARKINTGDTQKTF